jgi:hypothetical protein
MVTSVSSQAKEVHGDLRSRNDSGLAAMMAASQGGDMGAFETLYRSIAPPLRGYLRALAGDAVLAGTGAGILADGLQHLHCPLSDLRHLLVWHGGGMVLLVLFGWCAGVVVERLRDRSSRR